jgi:rhodanese-related sulfurtransferase
MKMLIAPLAALALLAGCQQRAGDEQAKHALPEMPMPQMAALLGPQDVRSMMVSRPEVALIDVRTPEEFAAGHIAGAVNIDYKAEDFADQVARLPKDRDYILYCRTGHRSGLAQEKMQGLGFRNISHMNGGITAWQEGGLPVED